jgi:hypothetical protein
VYPRPQRPPNAAASDHPDGHDGRLGHPDMPVRPTVRPGRSTAQRQLPWPRSASWEVSTVERRVLGTISVIGAVVAGILLGVILFSSTPTTLEVDYSPSSVPASEPAAPAGD